MDPKSILPLFAAAVVLLLATLTVAKDFAYCDGKRDSAVKVTGLDINPDPIVSGKPATFSIFASTGGNRVRPTSRKTRALPEEAISGGKLVIDVSYFFFHVHSETRELCSETSCPVSVGDFVIKHSQSLPSFTPPGNYKLTMKMLGSKGETLTCITFGFSIGFASSVVEY